MTPSTVAALVVLSVLAAGGVLFYAILIFVLLARMELRPWDASARDHSIKMAKLPYPIFAIGCWLRSLGQLLSRVPAPMEVTEHASAFLKSQVTFAVVQLGVPDKLLQDGPMTAAQLAAACGAADAEWLERVLRAAASIGLLGVRRVPRRNRDAASPDTDAIGKVTPAAAPEPLGGHEYVFSANAATAVLSTSHPSSMAPLVRLYQYNYLSSGALGKSLQRGMTSHELQTGTSFWAHLAADSDKGAVFDAAMHTFKDLGGASVVSGYKWGQYSHIVDVAGGNGSFLCMLLGAHAGIKAGSVLDQAEQVARGRGWAAGAHPTLAPRLTFVAGDMFDTRTVPSPPADGRVAYVLRNILHNWPDADALRVLCAIRAAIPASDAARTRLIIVELTASDGGLPPLLEPRLLADVQMLTLFGSGKERHVAQFETLLRAGGFRLVRQVPTAGVLVVLEAEPL